MFNQFDINSLIQIAMLIVISIQLYLLNKTYKADHERRKKQSTVEYINSIRNDYRMLNNKLNEKFPQKAIVLEEIDDKTAKEISLLLSILEHMSVGVNTGVYDFEILNRMSGSYLVNRYHQLYPHIQKSQEKSPTFFMEFEQLCARIEKSRKANFHSKKGNITYS